MAAFSSTTHLFLASETGSGKTLAYAAPVITALVRRRERGQSGRGTVVES